MVLSILTGENEPFSTDTLRPKTISRRGKTFHQVFTGMHLVDALISRFELPGGIALFKHVCNITCFIFDLGRPEGVQAANMLLKANLFFPVPSKSRDDGIVTDSDDVLYQLQVLPGYSYALYLIHD